jgi:hypothetical protein
VYSLTRSNGLNVGYRRQTGKHLLILTVTGFDPIETLAIPALRGSDTGQRSVLHFKDTDEHGRSHRALHIHKRLVGLERDAYTILIAPSHPAQPRGGYEHELIGKHASSWDREQRAAVGDIHNGALALDRVANRDLRGNTYGLSRIPTPLGVDVPKVGP